MSITDELREWASRQVGADTPWSEVERLAAIADHIDAEHERLMQEQPFTIDMVPITDESMAEHVWVKLPKDADGEYVHIGDRMEFSRFEIECPVTREVDGVGKGVFFAWCGERGYEKLDAGSYRHHKQPTVEDVLRDMHARLDEVTALYVGEAIDSDERDSDEARIFAEYAKRLTLRGDDE